TVRMYLREISGKTAQLIELSAQFGAMLAQSNQHIIHKARFIGHNLGMAFQIQDDILDYSGSAHLGKPRLEDLKNGVYTLPLIYTLRQKNSQLPQFLKQHPQLTDTQIQQIAQIVVEQGGMQAAQALARKYTNKAIALIAELP
ncbi:polyprenyl synthetase family protein, partial [Lactobacillus sp. XV13L]|nr:polyprenyl synthetase family protein [Lactobacillus sp. XV13L]